MTVVIINEGDTYISKQSGRWDYEGAPIPENFDGVNVVDGVLMIGNASPQCTGMYTVRDDRSVSSFLISEFCGWMCWSVLDQ